MTEPTQVLLDGRTVSRRLRLRAGQLSELVSSGRVRLFEGGRYDFDQVRGAVHTSSSTAIDVEDTEHEDSGAVALRTMKEHADRAMAQQIRMFELATKALEQSNDALRAENDALRARAKHDHDQIVALQDRHVKNLEAHEKVISLAHERELQTRYVEGIQKRRDAGLEMLKQAVPPIVAGIKSTFEQRSMLKEFIGAAPAGQLEALLELDFLNEKQKAMLAKLMKLAGRVAPAESAPSSSSSSSAPPPSQVQPSAGDGAPHHGAESAA